MKVAERIFLIIEKAEEGDKASRIFDLFIISLIILNVTAVILESFINIQTRYSTEFKLFEVMSVIIFSIEYILRLHTAIYKYKNESKFKSRIHYIFSASAIIDLFAILPFYIPFIIPIDLRFLRILRTLRILRILKIQRYSNSLTLIGRVLRKKKEDLIVTLFITGLLLLLSASVMYYIESDAQPDSFPNIIASFWWAIATLTTVGYGDVYPVTILGKILSGIIALLGIGIVALPTGIISSGFMNERENTNKEYKDEIKYCKYCGKSINDSNN